MNNHSQKRPCESEEETPRQSRRVATNNEASSSDAPPAYVAASNVDCSVPAPSYDEDVAIRPYVMDEFLATHYGQTLSKGDVWQLIRNTPDCTSLLLVVGMYLINNGRIEAISNHTAERNEQMISEGFVMLKCAAEERNDPMAHYILGHHLIHSSPAKAETHLRIAAGAGVVPAFVYVGQLIKRRNGTNGSVKEAFIFFKQGALLDDPEAHYAMFTMLLVGLDCVKDPTRAIEHLRRAAELGNRQAMFRYAEALYTGKGVQMNIPNAITFYARAAAKGCEKSCIILGRIYRKGLFPLVKNYTDSYKWYNRAMNQAEAKYQVARFLLKGRIPREDNWETTAENLLNESSTLGHVKAMYRLGLLKLKQSNKIDEARQLIKQAAQNGYTSAYKRLAKMERNADNLNEAFYYLYKGYEANDVACIFRLGEVYLDTDKPLVNQEEGRKLVITAAQKGYLKARIFAQRKGLGPINHPIRPNVNITTLSEKRGFR